MTDHTVPPIGMRMVKTAAAVLICLLVSMAVDREDMRIYSSIAALLCVQRRFQVYYAHRRTVAFKQRYLPRPHPGRKVCRIPYKRPARAQVFAGQLGRSVDHRP